MNAGKSYWDLTKGRDRCGLCRFWPQYPYAEMHNLPDSGDAGNGESDCRRHAPVLHELKTEGGFTDPARAKWPRTRAADWCGEFEPRDGRFVISEEGSHYGASQAREGAASLSSPADQTMKGP